MPRSNPHGFVVIWSLMLLSLCSIVFWANANLITWQNRWRAVREKCRAGLIEIKSQQLVAVKKILSLNDQVRALKLRLQQLQATALASGGNPAAASLVALQIQETRLQLLRINQLQRILLATDHQATQLQIRKLTAELRSIKQIESVSNGRISQPLMEVQEPDGFSVFLLRQPTPEAQMQTIQWKWKIEGGLWPEEKQTSYMKTEDCAATLSSQLPLISKSLRVALVGDPKVARVRY